ncbi:MAG: peptidase domain-containing ABC transporter [Cyclobacteriaceae bacterium]
MKYSPEQLKKFHVDQLGQYACGLACLSALTNYYEGHVPQEKIREISGTTLNGTSLLGLFQAAGKIGFETRGFEADTTHLKELDAPVILHVVMDGNRDHFVVCYGHDGELFQIGDPGWGIVGMAEDELSAIWQSRALLTIKPTGEFISTQSEIKSRVSWFKELIKEDIPILTVSGAIGIVMAVLGLSTAIFTQKLLDDFLPEEQIDKIIIGIVALVILLSARAVLGLIRGIFMARQGRDLNVRIIKSFIKKIIRLPMTVLAGYSTGDLIARMNDSLRIRNTVALVTGNVLVNALIILVSSVYLFTLSLIVGLLAVTSIAVFLLIAWRYHPGIIRGQKEVMAAHSANETQYVDALTGINTIKSCGKEEVFTERIQRINEHYHGKGYELALLGNRFSFISQLVMGFYIVAVFGFGIWSVISGTLLLGEMMAMLSISGTTFPAIAGLIASNIQLQEAKVAFNRMHELAALEEEELGTNESKGTCKSLKVENVSFRFPGAQQLLKNVSMEIPKGKIITLFGQVGSGKSTMVDLLLKARLVESGKISLDGREINQTGTSSWRNRLGIVLQKEKIFSSTVIDNICQSNDPIEIEKCIKFFNGSVFEEFIAELPQGYLTLCGEEGSNLSGGQKQMISIARAYYKQTDYLILDESTSAMDQFTEKKVVEFLNKRAEEGKWGVLMITHRISLASQSDTIFVLKNGAIEKSGQHQELLKNENDYSNAFSALIAQQDRTLID